MVVGCDRVFVYGTLRRGFPLHDHVRSKSLEFVENGRIRGRLYDLGEYPGAVTSSSPGEEIIGEVYRMRDPEVELTALDEVEEYFPERPAESLFVRTITDVRSDSGKTLTAWAYFLPREPERARVIRSGDYARRDDRANDARSA